MNTNKFYNTCLAALSFIFAVGCSQNSHNTDDNNDPETPEQSAKVTYSIQTLYDLSTFLDIEASYIDADGTTKVEAIESLPWSKVIEEFNYEGEVTLQLSFNRKQNIESTKESYKFGSDMTISHLNSSGSLNSSGDSESMSISGSQLEEALNYYVENGMTFSINVNAN